jgi:hypothetical protein
MFLNKLEKNSYEGIIICFFIIRLIDGGEQIKPTQRKKLQF